MEFAQSFKQSMDKFLEVIKWLVKTDESQQKQILEAYERINELALRINELKQEITKLKSANVGKHRQEGT